MRRISFSVNSGADCPDLELLDDFAIAPSIAELPYDEINGPNGPSAR
jgi:hypothetical protein